MPHFNKTFRLISLGLLLVVTILPAYASADGRWKGPDGVDLPFRDHTEVLNFLQTASVESSRKLAQGVTGAEKLLLKLGDVRAHAVFRTVREERKGTQVVNGTFRLGFRDDFIFEKAAYELNVLLGLDAVPPTVVRTIDGRRGTLQLWIENAMSEGQRREKELYPPDDLGWTYQVQTKMLFDRLINNDDRNLGNWLIDRDWKLWLIDHTRTFGAVGKIRLPSRVYWCSRPLWERLRSTDRDVIFQCLSPYLRDREIRALLGRWDEMVLHVSKLIAEKGEASVLFD